MEYLIIDGYPSGTGIRNYYNGGYIEPKTINLSNHLLKKLQQWLHQYRNEFFDGYQNKRKIENLDNEGKMLAFEIKKELNLTKIEYFSDALMIKTFI